MKSVKYLALTIISLYIILFVFTAVKYPETFVYIPNVPMTATVFNFPPANNITEPGEACDGPDVNGYTCATVAAGFQSGTLTCNTDRKSYNTSQCVVGNTIPATSCSQADVQTAIDSAVDGDIVIVPAGECTWDQTVIILDKNIVLEGSGIGVTIINDNTALGVTDSVLYINGSKPFKIDGFTFQNINDLTGIFITGNIINWRISNNSFQSSERRRGILIRNGISYGLVDNNIFINTKVNVEFGSSGDEAWQLPLELGKNSAVFIENNTFDKQGGNAVDSSGGARYVFRNNSLSNCYIEAHSNCYGSRATFSYEIYDNDINITDNTYISRFFSIRGGTGVIYNNVVSNSVYIFSPTIIIDNERSCIECTAPRDSLCNGESVIDGNSGVVGYPCQDQIGRSTDQGVGTAQTLSPLYEWNNSVNGADINITLNPAYNSCTAMSSHLQENRDYYNDTVRPGYVPYPYPHPLSLIDPTVSVEPTDTYTLNITTENGTVSKNPDKATYVAGEQVILEAINNPGYTFTGWSGALTGSTNPVIITIGD